MKRLIIILLGLVFLAVAATKVEAKGQRRQKTTRPRLERIATTPEAMSDSATRALLDSISFAGYDKPLRSTRETMFVTNSSARRLTRLWFTIKYSDMSNRELHSADIELGVDIPPGATRQISFPSWDKQLAFVFHRSARSSRSRGTPYTIALTLRRAEGKD